MSKQDKASTRPSKHKPVDGVESVPILYPSKQGGRPTNYSTWIDSLEEAGGAAFGFSSFSIRRGKMDPPVVQPEPILQADVDAQLAAALAGAAAANDQNAPAEAAAAAAVPQAPAAGGGAANAGQGGGGDDDDDDESYSGTTVSDDENQSEASLTSESDGDEPVVSRVLKPLIVQTEAMRQEIIKQQAKKLVDQQQRQIEDIRKFYSMIKSTCSDESWRLVRKAKRFEQWGKRDSNAFKLLRVIRKTHTTSNTGCKELDRFNLEAQLFQLRQGEQEEYTHYIDRVKQLRVDFKISGNKHHSHATFVLSAVKGLNKHWYTYKAHYLRIMSMKKPSELETLPTTLSDLATDMNVWISPVAGGSQARDSATVVPIAQSFANITKNKKKGGSEKSASVPGTDAATVSSTSSAPAKKEGAKPPAAAADRSVKFGDSSKPKKLPKSPCPNCKLLGLSRMDHWRSECPNTEKLQDLIRSCSAGESHFNWTAYYHDENLGPPICSLTRECHATPDVILAHQSRLLRDDVVLDNATTVGVFHNRDLLEDVRPVTAPVGITSVGGTVTPTHMGDFRGVPVYYWPDSPVNIVPQFKLEDKCRLLYDENSKAYYVYSAEDANLLYVFERREDLGNLRVCNMGSRGARRLEELSTAPPSKRLFTFLTVEQKKQNFTVREQQGADEALQFIRNLGYPSTKAAAEAINRGTINNVPATTADLHRSVRIYGVPEAGAKGKGRATTPAAEKLEPSDVRVPVEIDVEADLFFVRNCAFLLLLCSYGYAMCSYLGPNTTGSKNAANVWKSLRPMLAAFTSKGQRVTTFSCDTDAPFYKNQTAIEELGIKFNQLPPDAKCKRVERRIQFVKNKDRAMSSSLAFPLFGLLSVLCVLAAVRLTNFLPTAASLPNVSPVEMFTGVRPDFKRDLPHAFGDYGLIPNTTETRPYNSSAPRRVSALYIWKDKFYPLTTHKVRSARSFTPLPMPAEVVTYLHQCAASHKSSQYQSLPWSTSSGPLPESDPADDDEYNPPAVADLPLQRAVAQPGEVFFDPAATAASANDISPLASASSQLDGRGGAQPALPTQLEVQQAVAEAEVEAEIPPEPDLSETLPEPDPVPVPVPVPELERPGGSVLPVPVSQAETASSPPSPPTLTGVHRYPTRSNRTTWKDRNFSTFLTEAKIAAKKISGRRYAHHLRRWKDRCYHITLGKALKNLDMRKSALVALVKEIKSVAIDKAVFLPEDPKSLSPAELRKVIVSSLFFKEKFSPSGEFLKLKARLVAGGHMQDRSLYEESDISSPTVALSSVFLVLGVAARERRKVWTTDVGTAYLNARMPDDGHKRLMRLNPEMATVLVTLKPEYQRFLREDGSMIVRLTKALYGCVESAKLWYEELRTTLLADGFSQNPYDRCIFNKTLPSGKQLTAAVYVDDLLMTCVEEDALQSLVDMLKAKYKEISVDRDPVQSYLGMVLDFRKEGSCLVTMPAYQESILSDYNISGSVATPADVHLFDVRDSPRLSSERAQAFHSCVAKLLFLTKRARPDILTAVAFLTTRVSEPTEDDEKKLLRVLRYLNGTQHLGLRIQADSELTTIRAFVDASFAVHPNMRSHTGCAITLGAGAVFVKSTKQKLTAKSSTEAELIALSDALSQVIWTRHFLEAQGYDMGPAEVFEDNMSTIHMVRNGFPTSERTRHVNIRFFFIADRASAGEIKMSYCPTEDMIADLFTKPLQGEAFRKLRDLLLNVQH